MQAHVCSTHMGSAWQSGMLYSPGSCGSSSQLQRGPVPKARASRGMLLSATISMRRLPRAVMPALKQSFSRCLFRLGIIHRIIDHLPICIQALSGRRPDSCLVTEITPLLL